MGGRSEPAARPQGTAHDGSAAFCFHTRSVIEINASLSYSGRVFNT
jgi:hypothetical protein